jgi:hypothetical protein
MGRGFRSAAFAAVLSSISGIAIAAEGGSDGDAAEAEPAAAANAERSTAAGMFLPWTVSPRGADQRAIVQMQGGYDGARAGSTFEAATEARVIGPLSLRAGATYSDATRDMRPVFGLKLPVLSQGRHGVDGAVLVSYRGESFNLRPSIDATLAVGRRFDRLALFANLTYQQGLSDNERAGDARVAAMYRVQRRLAVGWDSRFRVDLERQQPEPAGEADYDLVSGPLLSVPVGPVAVTAQGGASMLKLKGGAPMKAGAVANLGVGAVF